MYGAVQFVVVTVDLGLGKVMKVGGRRSISFREVFGWVSVQNTQINNSSHCRTLTMSIQFQDKHLIYFPKWEGWRERERERENRPAEKKGLAKKPLSIQLRFKIANSPSFHSYSIAPFFHWSKRGEKRRGEKESGSPTCQQKAQDRSKTHKNFTFHEKRKDKTSSRFPLDDWVFSFVQERKVEKSCKTAQTWNGALLFSF